MLGQIEPTIGSKARQHGILEAYFRGLATGREVFQVGKAPAGWRDLKACILAPCFRSLLIASPANTASTRASANQVMAY